MRGAASNMTLGTVLSSDSDEGDGVFTPVTGWMPSSDWPSVRARWFNFSTQLTVGSCPGVQYSHDGVTAATPLPLLEDSSDPPEPLFQASGTPRNFADVPLPPSGTERMLVRFGFFTRRASGGALAVAVPVLWQFMPGVSRVRQFVLPPAAVVTKSSASTPQFFPATGAIPIQDASEVRATRDVLVISGQAGAKFSLGYRLSADGHTWSSAAVALPCFETYATEVGLTYSVWTSLGTGVTEGSDMFIQLGFLALDPTSPDGVSFAVIGGMAEIR